MKKYIYSLLILCCSTMVMGQSQSNVTNSSLSGVLTMTESEIPLIKSELQEIKEKPIVCYYSRTVHTDGCVCIYLGDIPRRYSDISIDNPINSTIINETAVVNERIQRCSCICIDGVKIRNPKCSESSQNLEVIEKDAQGSGVGLEGHNFIEDPAIIYPNPVKDIMNIKSTDPITVIEILNIHGQVEQIMDPREEQLDVSNLPAGIYYVRIYFENRKTVQVEKIEIVK